MARFYLKVGLFVLAVMFCILFGVSLANRGIERIQGQAVSVSAPKPKAQADAAAHSSSRPPDRQIQKTENGIQAVEPASVQTDTSMNHVGNKLGDLLQIVAHHGIKLFVLLFDSVFGH